MTTPLHNSNEAGIGHPTVEYLDKIDVDTVYLQFQTQSGDTHQIIVCTSLINNHKKALKDLLDLSAYFNIWKKLNMEWR